MNRSDVYIRYAIISYDVTIPSDLSLYHRREPAALPRSLLVTSKDAGWDSADAVRAVGWLGGWSSIFGASSRVLASVFRLRHPRRDYSASHREPPFGNPRADAARWVLWTSVLGQ